jgi:hypothetical protein
LIAIEIGGAMTPTGLCHRPECGARAKPPPA